MNEPHSAAAAAPAGANPAKAWAEVTHTLAHPLPAGEGDKIVSITLREPDVEALEAIDNLGLEAGKPLRIREISAIIAALSGVPIEAVRKMHKSDFTALGALAVPLLEEKDGA